ncbi:DUF2199 domain-containing protein [Thalassococcus sp. BH17M4-6]|uniref:DUF2199 domain-containing protein n=1 Tax=Thalassococcus sp. BH17M4-6 TaxID=3413148 RepID=UPI003BD9BF1F
MTLLDLDARWRRFNDPDRACPCCGQSFSGIFDIGFDHPDAWPYGERLGDSGDDLTVGEDRLGSDLCRLGPQRFVRCILPLPLRGSEEVFYFGVWASVAPEAFYAYLDASLGEEPAFEGCAGLLENALPGFDLPALTPGILVPGGPGERPRLMAQADTPLAKAQADGISFDDLLDIYAASGQDIRPHLQKD